MGMNIKSEEAHLLAREIAALTGESLTTAVTEALRERLERERAVRDPHRYQRYLAIGRDAAARLTEKVRTHDHGDLLYDDVGLPR